MGTMIRLGLALGSLLLHGSPGLAAGRLIGSVRDASGQPIAGAQVVARPADGVMGWALGRPEVARTTTATDGTFALDHLPAGDHEIVARAGSFEEASTVVEVDPAASMPAVRDFRLDSCPDSSVTVLLADGRPCRSAWVDLVEISGHAGTSMTRVEAGRRLDADDWSGSCRRRYTVRASCGAVVSDWQPMGPGEHLRIVLPEHGSLAGRVIRPTRFMEVHCLFGANSSSWTPVEGDGTFEIPLVPAGDGTCLGIDHSGRAEARPVSVRVLPGGTGHAELLRVPPRGIEVVVRDAATRKPLQGALALVGSELVRTGLRGRARAKLRVTEDVTSVSVFSEGYVSARFTDVQPGLLDVALERMAMGAVETELEPMPTPTSEPTPDAAAAGEAGSLRVIVEDAGGSRPFIALATHGSTRGGVAGITRGFQLRCGPGMSEQSLHHHALGRVTRGGVATASGLAPGPVDIFLGPSPDEPLLLARSATFPVAGEIETRVRMPQGWYVRGRTMLPPGTAHARVAARAPSPEEPSPEVVTRLLAVAGTDESGAFVLGPLPESLVKVEVHAGLIPVSDAWEQEWTPVLRADENPQVPFDPRR